MNNMTKTQRFIRMKEFFKRFRFFLLASSIIVFLCCALRTYFAPVETSLSFILLVWLIGALVGTLITYIPERQKWG